MAPVHHSCCGRATPRSIDATYVAAVHAASPSLESRLAGRILQQMSELISVVIPCYRQAHFLAQAVESVLAQHYSPYEVIVIDDGSPDALEQVIGMFPMVHCHHQDNQGLAAARNRGLALSTGDYVVFLDADDRLLPNALADGQRAFRSHPDCAFVWGFNRLIDAEGLRLPSAERGFSGSATYAQLLRENVVGPPVGVMFQRAALVEAAGFETCVEAAEDYELYLRLARTYDSHGHGKLVAEYRVHDTNMSADPVRMLRGMLTTLDRQLPWVNNSELRRALARGRENAREQFDWEPRLDRLRGHVRGRRWLQATGCATRLLVKYPRKFVEVVGRRARRSILPTRA
jgi:glycosyltransferase involved in cell wall biosynthesis